MSERILYQAENNLDPSARHIDSLQRLEGDFLTGNDIAYSVLVGLGEKEGTDITFESDSNPDVDTYTEVMTELGADVFVDYKASNADYNAEIIATNRNLNFDQFESITGRDRDLSYANQIEKAKTRGFPDEAIGWHYNDEVLNLVPSKLRGLYETEIDDPFMIPFGIKANQEVFDRYVSEYGIPRIEAIRTVEDKSGREIMPETPESEMFWQLVKEDQMPYDTSDLQELLEEESL